MENTETKYPKQVAHTDVKGAALDVAFDLVSVTEKDAYPPLEIHKGRLSRFTITLLETNSGTKQFYTANIPAKYVSAIYDKSQAALIKKFLYHGQTEQKEDLSQAYTVKIKCGKFLGKTPADVILESEENIKELKELGNYLYSNAKGKFEATNKLQVAAIQDALTLFNENKLQKVRSRNSVDVIYKSLFNRSYQPDKDGFLAERDISITCDSEKNSYPWTVTIENRKVKGEGEGMQTKDKKRFSIHLNDDEYLNIINSMKDEKTYFEQMWFPTLYKRAMAMDSARRNNR